MAEAAVSERADDFVEDCLKRKQIPGCSVMVRHDSKVVLAAGYGIANLEHRVRVTPQTVFHVFCNRGGAPARYLAQRIAGFWLGDRVVISPESETAFFEEDSDRTIRFVKDDSGTVTSLVISVPEELVLRRFP